MKSLGRNDKNPPIVQDDDISINEIFNVLSRQKITIFLTMVTMLLFATSYLLLVKPIYESRAVISIGKTTQLSTTQLSTTQLSTTQLSTTQLSTTQPILTQPGILEDPLLLVQRIKEKYKVGDITESSKTLPTLTAVDLDKKTANIVILKAQANSPKEAQEYLVNVVTPLLEEHQNLYSKSKSLQENRILLLEQELKDTDKAIAEFARQSLVLVNQDSAMSALLLMEKVRLGERRLELQKQLTEVKATMSEINIRPTELLREPTMPINPTKSKFMIITMATVVGVFLGLMAAFIKEYI